MKKILQALFIALIVLSFIPMANASSERGTKEEAKAMVKAAIAWHKAHGREKALAEANNPASHFRNKDLFVFAYADNGVNLAHYNPKMVGKALLELQVNGVYINKEFIRLGNSKDHSGWLSYQWPNLISEKMENKESYVEKYEDVLWICGYYR